MANPKKELNLPQKDKPNILIFNPDQWRGDILGHLGNPAALTPNLDRLINEDGGVSFRNAFCQNPVCTPSRCSYLTGWYPHTKGHRTMHYLLHQDRNEPNLLKVLKESGYYVWMAGKNDVLGSSEDISSSISHRYRPNPEDCQRWGFQLYPGIAAFQGLWRGDREGENYYSFLAGELEPENEENIWFDHDWACVYAAREFIQQYAEKGERKKPFCMYMPLLNPHPPYAVEKQWLSKIETEKIPDRVPTPLGKNEEAWEDKPSILRGIWQRQNLKGWDEKKWDELRTTYYGMCARMDHQFGHLVEALKQNGLFDNTIILFFSDHGDFTGDYGLVEKTQNTFEDCLSHVPLIIKPPLSLIDDETGHKNGHINDSMVELVDVSATIYDILNIDPHYTYFGKSLIPTIKEQKEEHKEAVYCEGGRMKGEIHCMERESSAETKPQGQYWPRVGLQIKRITDDAPYHTKATMCRTKKHKYVLRYYEKDEFYDLTNDPMELYNEIENPAFQNKIIELKEKMLRWYMATSDVVPHETDQRDYRTKS